MMKMPFMLDTVVEQNRGGQLVRRFAGRGNEPDPRDVKIASLKQRIQEIEHHQENPFSYVCDRENHHGGVRKETLCKLGLRVEIIECVGKVPSNYHGSLCSLGIRVSSLECVDKVSYYPGFYGDHHDNHLLTKETESEPIIWDIGDKEEEYPFVDNYLNFQEEENNVSFPGVVLRVKEESMPVYDSHIEYVIEEEDRFIGKGRFYGKEDNIKDVVVVANDLCFSMI
ncbi:hypothetical protein Tco_1539817 [Tanacetum coccineum]